MTLRRILPFFIKRGQGLDPDYQAVIDYAILQGFTLPTVAVQERDNQRVINLKAEGVWEELDVLYIMQQSSGCSDFARINFKEPSNFYLQQPPTLSVPSFVTDQGFTGGPGVGFNSGWNASIDAVKFINNNASFIMKGINVITSGVQYYAYARTANNINQIFIASVPYWIHRLTTTAGIITSIQINNHTLWNRGSNFREVYENGVQVYTNSGINGPGPFSNLELGVLAGNENGSWNSSSANHTLSYIGWGSDLSAKANQIYKIMEGTY